MNQQYKKTEKDLSFESLLTKLFHFLLDSSAHLPGLHKKTIQFSFRL